MLDAHTHLNCNKLFPERENHISDFENAGGNRLINVGADSEYNKNGIIISKSYKGTSFIKCTIGFHPEYVADGVITLDNIDVYLKNLEQMYTENKEYIVAIGEIGIDVHCEYDPKLEIQKVLFEKQLDLAKKYNLPVVIHSRDDFETTLDILKEYKDLKIYIHCRGYGPDEIKKVQSEFPNLRIGFCGNITYNSAQNLRDSLAVMNLNQLLIETDAPYLPTKKFRGQINTPAMITHLYNFISEFLNIDRNELEKIVEKNFDRLYIN